jgi:hypothetical protein
MVASHHRTIKSGRFVSEAPAGYLKTGMRF